MKVLFIGGVFTKENSSEVIANSKYSVDFAANIYQTKLIDGLRSLDKDMQIISAPFIGPYPNSYRKLWFRGFKENSDMYEYVDFCNVWGVRNISRYRAVKSRLQHFIKLDDENKLIIVYSAHTPFLKAALYAKRQDPRIKVCLIVLDLPQYMNLSLKQSLLYRCAKKYDINLFRRLNRCVDSYVLLTKHMTEQIDIQNRPYIIQEGLVRSTDLVVTQNNGNSGRVKTVFYAGTLNERYGVKTLVDAFCQINNDNLRLVICGRGDSEEYIDRMSKQNPRIVYMGQIMPEEVNKLMRDADILVNPRPNNELYTRYSFPSKNIEYLLAGKLVLGYKLDGMPNCYQQFMVIVQDEGKDEVYNMINAIEYALTIDNYSNRSFIFYAKENLIAEAVAMKIKEMNFNRF